MAPGQLTSKGSILTQVAPKRTILIKEGQDHVLRPGEEVPYRYLRSLGHGGCGVVEAVEDINTGRVYARKIVHLNPGSKTLRRQIFENEAKIIRDLLTHHHIIRVYATYYADPVVCLVLQPAADCGDLEVFLEAFRDEIEEFNADNTHQPDATKKSTLERAFGCLASGLAFMHQQRIRHKDIKCKNILVHQGSVIYTDFGISKDFSQAESSTTEGPIQSFTRRYSAPEILDRDSRNSKSDVYSLGCVYIEIISALTGAFDIEYDKPFSQDVQRIQRQIEKSIMLEPNRNVAKLAISMTSADQTKRPRSADVRNQIQAYPGYICEKCQTPRGTRATRQLKSPIALHPDVGADTHSAEAQGIVSTDKLWEDETYDVASLQNLSLTTSQSVIKEFGLEEGPKAPSSFLWYQPKDHLNRPLLPGNIAVSPSDRLQLPNLITGGPDKGAHDLKDPNYRTLVPIEAQDFFKVGRVFSLLNNQFSSGKVTWSLENERIDIVKYGDDIAQRCSFVVVQVMDNYVRACALPSYVYESMNSSGSYCAAFLSGSPPKPVDTRGSIDTREPVEIERRDPHVILPGGTEIRLSKTYNIEWSVKIRDIGMVIPEHRIRLVRYWRDASAQRREKVD
ncbi:kinase-like protein [Lentithecium fluviatile CBS 122367]|uniref:Kinase-like protein n=1 Tax=Lentithecium fluviatile CBS 122367 TaxID=1168545 RepID=A0A6G1ITA3_9PLEO|nr:kinase-like protein [Lentithecium fluviatile CBS 122367]